jgi:hypothetical protein
VTGSIKFDLTIDPQLLERATALRSQWQAQERPVWIAASTHEGEDEVVLAAHHQLLAGHPDALLILVPRHPERFNSVFELCQQQGFPRSGAPAASRSPPPLRCCSATPWANCCFSMPWPTALSSAAAWCPTAGITCWSRRRWPNRC